MSEKFHSVSLQKQNFQPSNLSDQILPLDLETGGVDPLIKVNAILGISRFRFEFFNEGGRNNLLPGRPTTQTKSLPVPPGTTHGVICLQSISGAFVTNGGVNLTERPLGQFAVFLFFGENNTINCEVRLTDSNSDDPVDVFVEGTVMYFR